MKFLPRESLTVFGAVLLALLIVWLWGAWRQPEPPRLAVALVAIETNAAARPVKAPTVNANFKGLCAVFAITNVGKDASIWFDTCAVEQRVGSGWRRFEVQPYKTRGYPETGGANPWHAIASDLSGADFAPGRYLNYVVEWPREVPTNASWRLELRCGIEPSTAARKWDANLGIRWFTRRRSGQTIYTAEVRLGRSAEFQP